ncbi:hypothetical protein ACFUUZ_19250, partial [Nocardia sp. NPDC057353]
MTVPEAPPGAEDLADADPVELWQGLYQMANDNFLQFDPQDAVTAANAVIDLLDDLRGIKNAISTLKLDAMDPIAKTPDNRQLLTSGHELAMVYSTKAKHLAGILDDHIEVATLLGDTFVMAGKKYTGTDSATASSISTLSSMTMPTGATEYRGSYSGYGTPSENLVSPSMNGKVFHWGSPKELDAYAPTAHLKDFKSKDTSVEVQIETKSSLSFKTMYELGQYLDPEVTNDHARHWHTMATDITNHLNKMLGIIKPLNRSWVGAGGEMAQQAVDGMSDRVKPLTDAMVQVSRTLEYTANWLLYCKMSMPTRPEPANTCCPDPETNYYRDQWQKHYGDGMKTTVESMPFLPGAPDMYGNEIDQPPPPGSEEGAGDPNDPGNQGPGYNYPPGFNPNDPYGNNSNFPYGYNSNDPYGNSNYPYGNNPLDPYGNMFPGQPGQNGAYGDTIPRTPAHSAKLPTSQSPQTPATPRIPSMDEIKDAFGGSGAPSSGGGMPAASKPAGSSGGSGSQGSGSGAPATPRIPSMDEIKDAFGGSGAPSSGGGMPAA